MLALTKMKKIVLSGGTHTSSCHFKSSLLSTGVRVSPFTSRLLTRKLGTLHTNWLKCPTEQQQKIICRSSRLANRSRSRPFQTRADRSIIALFIPPRNMVAPFILLYQILGVFLGSSQAMAASPRIEKNKNAEPNQVVLNRSVADSRGSLENQYSHSAIMEHCHVAIQRSGSRNMLDEEVK